MEKIRFSFTLAVDKVKTKQVADTLSQILHTISADGEEGANCRLLSASADVILPDGTTISAGRAEMPEFIKEKMGL